MNSALNTANKLQGMGVVVTRPAHQAERLCRLIEAQGGTVICFPTLEILAPRDPAAILRIIERLGEYDVAIFTSPNAVEWALTPILARRGMPPDLKMAAVGKGSARALECFGVVVDWAPVTGFGSEALLSMSGLQDVTGLNIVIFKGEGGRELLGETLEKRGARLSYVEVYRRSRPKADPDRLLCRWRRGEIHAVTATSTESLRNLFEMIGEVGQQWLRDTPLVIISERTRQAARGMGFNRSPVIAGEASDEAIVEALLQLNQQARTSDFGDPP